MKLTITTAYEPEFPLAPTAVTGERVTFLRVDPKNPAWFFGRDARGIEGFFPCAWFTIDERAQTAVAGRAYAAAELRVAACDVVTLEERHGGWLFVRTADGRCGWIPEDRAAAG
ncbi:MAG TPA: hypothetical protein VGD88_12820 [Opitutaceae bacterium]